MDIIQFLIWPLAACVVLVAIHTYFGIHILQRGIIFVDLALAQFIGIGIALSCVVGEDKRFILSLLFAVIGSLVLTFCKSASRYMNVEAFIGVIYIFSLAASMLILDQSPHGLEEFKAMLNGNILWVTPSQLLSTVAIYGGVGLFHYLMRRRFTALSREGTGGIVPEFLFFFSFALVLIKSVTMAGILQVFAFLVIPALIGRLFWSGFRPILFTGWLVGTAASILGITLSFALDIPTAPIIVMLLSLSVVMLLVIKALWGSRL